MSARLQVATVRGFRINNVEAQRSGTAQREGLSATVCDTLYNWREVKTYRSETQRWLPGGGHVPLGVDGALAAARDHARYLNRLYGAA